MKNSLHSIEKKLPVMGLRISNGIENILDAVLILILFFAIALASFAFTFAFTPSLLIQFGSKVGIYPFGFLSNGLVADAETASVKTLQNSLTTLIPLIFFVWLRRWILTPLTRSEICLLLIAASPLPVWFIVSLLDLPFCVFPLSEIKSDGALVTGTAMDSFHFCERIIEGDTTFARTFGILKVIYALALLPLNLALLSYLGLITFSRFKWTRLSWTLHLWPWYFLKNIFYTVLVRFSSKELRSLVTMLLLTLVFPAASFLSILPHLSEIEFAIINSFIPEKHQDGPVSEFFVGMYSGPGRQILLLSMALSIFLIFSNRFFAASFIALSVIIFPATIYYLFTNHYLVLVSLGNSLVIGLFIFIAGWSLYIVAYPHLRQLLRFALSTILLASRKAIKDARRGLKPIIYLRPFSFDKSTVPTLPSAPLRLVALQPRIKTIEACIAEASFKFAPLVALGDPNVENEPVGAVREYTSNNQWKDHITELLASPRAVIFLVGATSATKWEIETIISNDLLRKTIFILPTNTEIVRSFFAENPSLLEYFGLEESELVAGVQAGWTALWSDYKNQKKAFSAGRVDELTYKLAVARALKEL